MSLKEEIIRLRKENRSYKDIATTLQCSKGSVSYHCNKLGLNKPILRNQDKNQRNIINMRLTAKAKYAFKRNEYFNIGQNLIRNNINDRILTNAIISYYCEGSKTKAVTMANSDPILHNIFIIFMNKYFPGYSCRISFISYTNGISPEEVERYWLNLLNINNYTIGKHYRKETHHGKQNCPYGTCYIRYSGVSYLYTIIMGCIYELTGADFINKNR